ncbi:N-acetyltransferase [Paraburkholderia sp. J12]|uniref:GNAT family N-acetyltransferase n=1 Tax=Paraburkholderia sp. J12 TaxID=2805432 RepID=UPI002ABE6B15|nr:N-acetyltransferase [Paraburkholderia sp. J12]
MTLVVRPEQPSDVAAIESLTTAAFLDAPHTSHTEQHIVNALRRAGQLTVSLVAEDGSTIVGHVAVSPVAISGGRNDTEHWYGLGPISVAPARQREGIGSRLMEAALAELRRLGAAGCVLLGDPHYYGRFGFRSEPRLVLPGVPPEYFQALALQGGLPSGIVSYHRAFEAQAPAP